MGLRITLISALVASLLFWCLTAGAAKVYPPWAGTPTDGKKFSLRCANDLADLHGDVVDPQLVVFFRREPVHGHP